MGPCKTLSCMQRGVEPDKMSKDNEDLNETSLTTHKWKIVGVSGRLTGAYHENLYFYISLKFSIKEYLIQ